MAAKINIAEIATLGTQIAELGQKLQELRDERRLLDEKIRETEDALMLPLRRHTELLAEIAGRVAPLPPAPSPAPSPVLPESAEEAAAAGAETPSNFPGKSPPPRRPDVSGVLRGVDTVVLKKKIQNYIQGREGVSALEVAEAIGADPLHVRHLMVQMSQAG